MRASFSAFFLTLAACAVGARRKGGNLGGCTAVEWKCLCVNILRIITWSFSPKQ